MTDSSTTHDTATGDDPLFYGVGGVCESAARLTGADSATATLIASPDRMELMYATNELGDRVDELQFLTGEGPCLDAHRDNTAHAYFDINTNPATWRWPTFAAGATALGVRAMVTFPIPGLDQPLGVLELTHRTPQRLDPPRHRLVAACASAISAIVYANLHELGLDNVVAAHPPTSTRSQFQIATGMISEQLACPTADAADLLRAHSYAQDRSIRSVANDLITRRLRFDGRGDITTTTRPPRLGPTRGRQ